MYTHHIQYSQSSGKTDCICAGLHIVIDEAKQQLQLDGRMIALTPTEYRLRTLFFQQWMAEQKESLVKHNDIILFAYLTADEMQQELLLASQQLLRKHISNANGKLLAHNIQIRAIAGGYVLLRTVEEENEEAYKDAARHAISSV